MLPYEYLMSPQYGGKTILKDILFELVPRQLLERPKWDLQHLLEIGLKAHFEISL